MARVWLRIPYRCEKLVESELVALKGKLYSKSFKLPEGAKIVIGRGQDVDIQIFESGLSRRHCVLERKNGAVYINDLGSRNGTFVNGKRVERQELKDGDSVRFAAIEFQFCFEPEHLKAVPKADAGLPAMHGPELKEKMQLDGSGLMELPEELQSIENFRRIQRDLATVYRIGNLINAETDLNTLYERILDAIFQVVQADRAFLLIEDSHGNLKTAAERERKPVPAGDPKPSFSSTIVQECFEEGTSILRANAMVDKHYGAAESVIIQNIHSVICVPLESPERNIGVIYSDTVAESKVFEKHHLELLTAVGKQAGVAVHRAKLANQVRQLLYGTVRALVATIEAKDVYTRGHSERVTAYALQIGKAMGLNESMISTLELGGFLHDVGKIGVPESILRKAGPLTDEEFRVVKEHPKVGYSILGHIEGAETIAEIVLHHHERWDGKGYPDGVVGEGASLLARILTVADSFDAMGSKRPYRDRLAQEKVLDEIKRGAGTQFDPKVAETLVQEAEAGRIWVELAESATVQQPGMDALPK